MSAAVERARVRRRLSRLIMSALLEMARRRGVEPRELTEDARTLEALALACWAARDADLTAERPRQWPAPPPPAETRELRPERTDLRPERLPGPPPLPAGVSPSQRPTAPPPPDWMRERTPVVHVDAYPQIEMSEVDFAEAETSPQTPAALSARLRRR